MARPKFWTDDKILEEAKKHNSKRAWNKASPTSHKLAKKDDELFAKCIEHMDVLVNNWTLEQCEEKAKKFGSASKWDKGCSGSYFAAKNTDGWLEACERHYQKPKQVRRTNEELRVISEKYKTPAEWKVDDYNSYMSAYRKKLIPKFFESQN
ncbi:hypothetical protein VCHA53O466_50178 [Vibrio chagasii]|nr:hypothetical protein VCHA53O466_50178 [Vibrio chagasii]